jgi:hypothetical protein
MSAIVIPLGDFHAAKDVFMAIEIFPGEEPCIRLTLSHPDPDRHIAVAMSTAESLCLVGALTAACIELGRRPW